MKNKIAIIGAGPIGSILGAHLARNGQSVVLVDILEEHLKAIKTKGLKISGLEGINVKIPDVCLKISELKKFSPEYIFICVKGPVLRIITPEIKKTAAGQAQLISFQNGIDTEEFIAAAVGRERTLRAVVNYAGNLVAPGQIKMSFFNKPNYIGAAHPAGEKPAREIAQLMTQAGLDTEFTPDIKKYIWEKTILNASLSPVTALTKQTMKQAMDFAATRQLVVKLLEEGVKVAKKLGYDYGSGFLDHSLGYLDKAGHHKTSMHVDVDAQRLTEIEFLNMKIVEYGHKHQVAVPANESIVNLIKGMENTFGG